MTAKAYEVTATIQYGDGQTLVCECNIEAESPEEVVRKLEKAPLPVHIVSPSAGCCGYQSEEEGTNIFPLTDGYLRILDDGTKGYVKLW